MLDANNIQGSLGEISVTKELYKTGYIVYTQYSGFSPFDLVAYKLSTKTLYRISVKSTIRRRNDKWRVDITQKMYTSGQIIKVPFDNTNCDILAVYLPIEDRVVFLNSSEVKVKSVLSIPVLAQN
jgi:hypothetical protein